jgi:polyisoprenoid-binding protein YceI
MALTIVALVAFAVLLGKAEVTLANGDSGASTQDSVQVSTPAAAPAAPATPAAPAANPATKLVLAEGSVLEIDGDSNVHHWSSKATTLRVNASIPAAAPGDVKAVRAAILDGQPARFEIRIPVKGLKSGKDKLDANMYKALDEPTHPEIVFTLDRYQPAGSGSGSDTIAVATKGRVKVAGKEKAIEMRVVFTSVAGGLRVKGSADLKMTDFGIKPPTMMLGTLRTHDDIVIKFDLGLKPVSGSGKS